MTSMELHINDKVTIQELQQQFNKEFPYLKLEVFDILLMRSGSQKSHFQPNHKSLGMCRKLHNEGTINLTPHDSVDKLEKTFWENYGLSIEVFRKSGNLWIETTLTDSWSLKHQNEEGKALSDNKHPNDYEAGDKTVRDKQE
jgi:hypothetical protein